MNYETQHGFTLLEVLISLAIFSLLTAAFSPAMMSNVNHNQNMQEITNSIHVAQIVMDDLRFENPGDLPLGGQGDTQILEVHGKEYAATPFFCETAAYCDAQTRHIRLEVAYEGEVRYEVETVYTQLR